MKKAIKFGGILIATILLLLVLGGIYIGASDIPTYETEEIKFTATVDSASIAEGERIAAIMCSACHMSEDGKLGGKYMADAADFGTIYSRNITQHPEYGINDYTDAELAYLLRTGVTREGQYIPPYMPKFPHLSDKDLNSIIAFLRSDHQLVQPSSNNPPPSQPSFLNKMLCRIAFKPLPYPEEPVPEPDRSNKQEFGKYLATAKFDCYGCHSADFKTFDPMYPEKTAGFFGGGNPIPDEQGEIVYSANLTMDEQTGIGGWTEDEFIRAVKFGIRPDKPALKYPMQPYSRMTDEEASAIWAYLQTVPEIQNDVMGMYQE